MPRLPVKKGVDGIPTGLIPSDPQAFVYWFTNSFLPRWAANADTRNAVAGNGISIAGDISVPATVSVSDEVGSLFAQPYVLLGAPVAPAVLSDYRSIAAQANVLTLIDGGATNAITVGVAANGIGNGQLRQGTATSVIGNVGGAIANVADVVASADNTVLVRASGALGFSALPLAAIASIADKTVLGNVAGSSAAPVALNLTQLTTLLDPIVPTWTGKHTFNGALTATATLAANSAVSSIDVDVQGSNAPRLRWTSSAAAADSKFWEALVNSAGTFALRIVNDAYTVSSNGLVITRTATAFTNFALGNATDNPTYSFLGTGLTTHTGDVTVGAAARTGAVNIISQNTSAADGDTARVVVTSGTSNVSLFMTNTAQSTAIVVGGPIGLQACLRTLGAAPIVFGTGNQYAGSISGTTGGWTIRPYASGNSILVNSFASGDSGIACVDPGANNITIALNTTNSEASVKATGTGATLGLYTAGVQRISIANAGAVTTAGTFAINGGTPATKPTGYGTPVGTPTAGLTNASSLAQTAGTLAALLLYLKGIGFIGA